MWRKKSFLDLGIFGGGRHLPKHLANLSGLDLLIHANQELERGDCLEAAQIYEYIAEEDDQGQTIRAAYLFLQSGHAYIVGSQHKEGLRCVEQGLSMLARNHRLRMMQQMGNRIISELNYRGLRNEAQLVTNWLDIAMGGSVQAFGRIAVKRDPTRPLLPPKCSNCGGNLLPDELEWLSSTAAECPFCGSAVGGSSH